MLEVKELHKLYGEFHAVRGVTFDVNQGEIAGFLGPNGAGKTTTMKIITGFMLMTSGQVRVDGLDVLSHSLAVRSRIGYLPENAPLYEDMTVLEYFGFMAEMRGLKADHRRERIEHVIGVCGLESKRLALIKTLSKGFRQRVGLGQAIIHEPKLVVLDEPTIGLDPNQIADARELIREIGEKNTVILSSHILSEVEATCSRVIIVNEGAIVANGTSEELQDEHGATGRYQVVLGGADEESGSRLGSLAGVDEVDFCGAVDGALRYEIQCGTGDRFTEDMFDLAGRYGWSIREIRPVRPSLEGVFKALTRPVESREVAVKTTVPMETQKEDVDSGGEE